MLAAGRSAARQVRGVAPSTSWVALCAWAKASSAGGMSWSAELVVGAAGQLGQPALGDEYSTARAGPAASHSRASSRSADRFPVWNHPPSAASAWSAG